MLAFGTSGLRGLVSDMTDQECYSNAKGFIAYLLKNRRIAESDSIALAGDLRPSTERIMRSVARAINDSGCCVDHCGRIPSPAVLFHAMGFGRASIMVTGSHIPEDRNGIKFNQPSGEILKDDEPGILAEVMRVRHDLASQTTLFDATGAFSPESVRALPEINPAAEAGYLKRYTDFFSGQPLVGKKIVVDQHSAVGRDLLVRLLQHMGAEVVACGRTEHFLAKDTENITPTMAAEFRQLAREHQPFAIVSMDGDSDRPFVVDETGTFHRGDLLGAVVANYLQADCAAVPVSANDAVVGYLRAKNIRLLPTRIGSPYVVAAMQKALTENSERVVGWEVNGGFMTASDIPFANGVLKALPSRDALLAIGCSLIAGVTKGSMRALFAEFPQRFTQAGLLDQFPIEISQPLTRGLTPAGLTLQITYDTQQALLADSRGSIQTQPASAQSWEDVAFWKTEHAANNVWALKTVLEHYFSTRQGFGSIQTIEYLDGVKIVFANQDVAHIRPSGNAPQLRLYATANSQSRADEIIQMGLADHGILRQMAQDIQHVQTTLSSRQVRD